jgi:hypothetical protein
MKAATISFLILGMLVCIGILSCLDMGPPSHSDQPGQSGYGILGLAVGESTWHAIQSKLGPTITFKLPADADIHQMCYVSDMDNTLLVFRLERNQCTRFSLMARKDKFYRWDFCEISPLVSEYMATDNGVKLGMSKEQIIAILGKPRKESGETMSFDFVSAEKEKRTVYIETHFSESKLVMLSTGRN